MKKLSILFFILLLGMENGLFAAPIVFKLANIAPSDSPWYEGLLYGEKLMMKETNGRLKMKPYMGGQLGDEIQMTNRTIYGSIECSAISTGAVANIIPSLQVFEFPFMFESYDEVQYVIKHYLNDYFKKKFREKGLELISWTENGWRDFFTVSKLIKTPSDLKGMRIRSQESKIHLAAWKKLGAIPIPLPIPKVMAALNSGLILGGENTVVLITATGWWQKIKYLTISRHIFQPVAYFCNKKWFDKLPNDLQVLFPKITDKIVADIPKRLVKSTAEFIEEYKNYGITVYKLSPEERKQFYNKLKDLPREYRGLVGGDVIDLVEKAKKEYIKNNAK